MKRLLLMALLLPAVAFAEPHTQTWQNATTRVDGTPFTLAELAETRIYCDGDTVPVHVVTDDSEAATFELPLGTHTCFGTHVDTKGAESDPSNSVTFELTEAKPSPPIFF